MDEMEDATELFEEDEAKPKLEGATRMLEVGGRAILVAYGIGFFIDSYFDAKYGVTYLNPFRSRVAFTGIALVIQVAIIVLIFTGESTWRVSSSLWERRYQYAPSMPRKNLYKGAFSICWAIEAVFLALLLRFALTLPPSQIKRIVASVIATFLPHTAQVAAPEASTALPQITPSLGIGAAIMIGISLLIVLSIPNMLKQMEERSRAAVDIAAAITICFGLLFLTFETRGLDALGWSFVLYVILVRFVMVARQTDPRFRLAGPRLTIVALAIAIPILYAERLYPNIRAQWGGAPKISLVMRFEHQIVPFGCVSPALLLEETEEGFYLLRPDSDPAEQSASNPTSLDLKATPCPETPPPEVEAEKSAPQHPFDPRAYSAVYVPRREVFQVLYQRTSADE